MKALPKLPYVVETQVLAKEIFFEFRKEKLRIAEQEDYHYYTLQCPSFAVMVVATTEQNDYVLNWEYRHPVKQILLSCPGGIMNSNETATECARRELLEETGFSAERFKVMGESYPFPGICTQKIIYVRAFNAVITQPQELEHAEFIETELFTPDKLKKALNNNTPIDGLLLTALFFAQNPCS